jgi:hypothetical protein
MAKSRTDEREIEIVLGANRMKNFGTTLQETLEAFRPKAGRRSAIPGLFIRFSLNITASWKGTPHYRRRSVAR